MMQIKSIQQNLEDEESYNPIDDLRKRVEELETEHYVTEEQVQILLEIIRILSEIPSGKQILNRALNLRELDKLQQTILPRRREDLNELLDVKMPEGIREEMATRQLDLIKKTLRHISHRRHFENNSAQAVRTTMEKLFNKFRHKNLTYKGGHNAPNR